MDSIFAKIIRKELPADIVLETDNLIVIKDLYPAAPIHLLIIPKKQYNDLQSLPKDDLSILGDIVLAAQNLAKEFGIESGYRLLTNIGPSAGQSIFHLHFHLIGGRPLGALG